jgi:hypothetical protein
MIRRLLRKGFTAAGGETAKPDFTIFYRQGSHVIPSKFLSSSLHSQPQKIPREGAARPDGGILLGTGHKPLRRQNRPEPVAADDRGLPKLRETDRRGVYFSR